MQPQYLTCHSRAPRAGRGGGSFDFPTLAGPTETRRTPPQRPGATPRDDAGASSADTYWREKLRDAAVGVGDVILLAGFVLVMLYDLLSFDL